MSLSTMISSSKNYKKLMVYTTLILDKTMNGLGISSIIRAYSL